MNLIPLNDRRFYYAADGDYALGVNGETYLTGYCAMYTPASESVYGVDRFEVYTDDGRGNGTYVGSFSKREDAIKFIDQRCAIRLTKAQAEIALQALRHFARTVGATSDVQALITKLARG